VQGSGKKSLPASFPFYKLSHKDARRIFLHLKIFLFAVALEG
jgi:hypothetical protein